MTIDASRERRRARRLAWLASLGGVGLRLLACTWRVQWVNQASLQSVRAAGGAVILVLWHGDLLPLLWFFRRQGITILISEHRDGEVVARAALSLGHRTIRGSTTRGGNRAILAICRVLEAGGDVAFTPDGPRGPARVFAPGALIASQRTGVPIVALGVATARAWRLTSWDAFLIPKPFARVTIAVSDPAAANAATAREAAEQAPRFAALLNDAGAVAARG